MRILIVDDHDLFSEGLKLLIKNLNSEANSTLVKSYQDGLVALEEAEKQQPYDLVLLDYCLPDALPEQDIQKFCDAASSSPVVVVSSEDRRDVIRMTIRAGAAGFIPKSSSKKELISALDLVISGGTFLPRQVLSAIEPTTNPDKVDALTNQQLRILSFVVKGASNKVIAAQMEIAEGTVKAHLHNAFKVLGVTNRTEAVLAVAKNRIKF